MDVNNHVRELLMMPGASNFIGMLPGQQDVVMGHASSDVRNMSIASRSVTEQEKALGCQACTNNQVQRQKRGAKKRNRSASSNSEDPILAGQGTSTAMAKVELPTTRGGNGRRGKMRSPGGSMKSENNKGDVEVLVLHSRVQEMFASHLSTLLSDPAARDLQCCVTYGKPCGCIRKYVLAGMHWKDNSFPNLRIGLMKDKDDSAIAASDRAAIAQVQMIRARELLEILHRAAELKKEKCYNVTSEGADGKPLKELRGMIGLGNGRKRSKKYEDYVLEKRGKLRDEYSLCEKAAQKLLGYSINFLYKKLRTNPQKTSRLVATNKAERASKVPRHLISLQQLQEMANNQQSASQCCCRNCISWLVKEHFDKIVNWRQRLEGSGQRVAQEIVAEVLLASASLDGQNSFCQNLVHWVTGCSFKKIRRVRDHLKKDPKSLPEHGLKKYWKDKVRNQAKSRNDQYSKPVLAKVEKDIETSYPGRPGVDRFPTQYDSRLNSRNNEALNGEGSSQISNLNNSNNRYDSRSQYIPSTSPTPPNRTVTNGGMSNMFPGVIPNAAYNHDDGTMYQPLQRQQPEEQSTSHQMYIASQQAEANMLSASGMGSIPNFGGQGNMSHSFRQHVQPNNTFQETQDANYNNQVTQQSYIPKTIGSDSRTEPMAAEQLATRNMTQPQHQEPEPVQYHDVQAMQPANYTQQVRSKDDQAKFYPAPLIAGFSDPNGNVEGGQPSYYFATNPGNSQQDGFFHTGMTPLFLAQPQQPDGSQADQDGGMPSQLSGQSFFLLSPALPNNQDKHGNFNPSDFENWKQMMMPLTPIQMYPASYFQNGMQNEAGDGKNVQAWGADPQQGHFMFPVGETNMAFNAEQDPNYPDQQVQGVDKNNNHRQHVYGQNQPQQYFQPALTPVAVMQPQGSNLFSNVGWFATQPSAVQQVVPDQNAEPKKSDVNSRQYMVSDEQGRTKYFENRPSEQPQVTQYMLKDGQYYEVTKPQELPMMSQWVQSNQTQGFTDGQRQTNQWINAQGDVQSQKTQYIQQQPLEVNTVPQPQAANEKISVRNQMPPLAPIPGVGLKTAEANLIEQKHPEMPVLANITTDDNSKEVPQDDNASPKGASITDRSKRFSRDRLRATIDSPGLIPPMTPLTPALTPSVIAVSVAANETSGSGKEGNLSASSTNSQALESSIFRFPPAHISRRMAALRMQGHTTDIAANEKGKATSPSDPGQGDATAIQDSGVETTSEASSESSTAPSSQKKSSTNSSGQNSGTSLKNVSGSLGSASSLGYISEAFMQPDNTLLVDLTNVKTLPVLSLPSAGWSDENVTINTSTSDNQADQTLQTPIQVLNTPTHQLTPSVTQLHTPTHQLHTPNQALNTPTHPLNTPTLNTPTDLQSPSHASTLVVADEESPVKVLLPAPAGKKRKADADVSDVGGDKPSKQKQIRFHFFTPTDFESGEVNVSAFRKPSEFVSGSSAVVDSTIAKRRRKPRKQTNPQAHGSNQSIEIQDHDTDKSDQSVDDEGPEKEDSDVLQSPEKETIDFPIPKSTSDPIQAPENVLVVGNPMQFPALKTPSVLQRITPVFSMPTSASEDMAQPQTQLNTQQTQLNTPVFIHSGALVTPSSRLSSAMLRRASPNKTGATGRVSSSSTPQFFTFVPGSGFPTPTMFFSPQDLADPKKSAAKQKSSESTSDATSDKTKRSPAKRGQMTLSFSQSNKDDALQTPSKIQVVTPSGAVMSDMPQIFCFQDTFAPHMKTVSTPGSEKSKTPDSKDANKTIDSTQQARLANTPSTSKDSQSDKHKKEEPSEPVKMKQTLRSPLPSLVVNPPSDGEEDVAANKEPREKSQPRSSPEKSKSPLTSPGGKRTLHRARSGGKTDLVLSLKHTNSPAGAESSDSVTPSPLNTPAGIQVVTPTMATVMSASKLGSPIQRFPPGMRVRPQSLMMAPICMNPGNTATSQVATPTLFHIISPSQAAPPSPSVLVYPYPSRGFVRGTAPLSSGSLSSPAFGIIPRPNVPSGSNSGSLLKSALMKTFPVFQFPPHVRATTPTTDIAPSSDKDHSSTETSQPAKSSDVRNRANSAPDYCDATTPSSSSVNVSEAVCRPSSADRLSDKLSGANDPCLSEAAQKD